MKTCPVCRARTFDDAEVCYGCMHRYDDAAGRGGAESAGTGLGFGETAAEPFGVPQRGAPNGLESARSEEGRAPSRRAVAETAARRAEIPDVTRGVLPARAGRHVCAPTAEAPAGHAPLEARPTERVVEREPVALAQSGGTGGAAIARPDPAPFDGAGWIVRFELPGAMDRPVVTGGDGAPVSRGDGVAESRLDGRGDAREPCSLVVSIRPAHAEARGGAAAPDAATPRRTADSGRRRGDHAALAGATPRRRDAAPSLSASVPAPAALAAGEGILS